MNTLWQVHLIYGVGLFLIGTVVGSFLNVCIYRIPWEKSVIWPGSHCPRCLAEIEARDNVPILGWLFLRGACRSCHAAISPRYPLIELMIGVLFTTTYFIDGVFTREYVRDDHVLLVRVLYHVLLIAFLVTITFIDADLTIVPAGVTNLGIALGLTIGAIFPGIRPVPNAATSWAGGLWAGVLGMLVGGLLIAVVRVVGGLVFRREAMGSGDIHILAMIGVFLGWQAAVVTFFLAPFFGLAPALVKLTIYLGKRLRRRPYRQSDRELPFGPYLSLAALTLLFTWGWIWPRGLNFYFETFSVLFWFLIGREV